MRSEPGLPEHAPKRQEIKMAKANDARKCFSLIIVDVGLIKKRETVVVARSTHRGSGFAHRSRTSKHAEASRRICQQAGTRVHTHASGTIYISTRASTVCLILDYDLKLPDFYASRKSVSEDAFIKKLSQTRPQNPRPGFYTAV